MNAHRFGIKMIQNLSVDATYYISTKQLSNNFRKSVVDIMLVNG
jgi:hypothetical protein